MRQTALRTHAKAVAHADSIQIAIAQPYTQTNTVKLRNTYYELRIPIAN